MFMAVFCHSIKGKTFPAFPPEVSCDVYLLSVSENARVLSEPDAGARYGKSSQLERGRCSPSASDLSREQEDRDVFSDYKSLCCLKKGSTSLLYSGESAD